MDASTEDSRPLKRARASQEPSPSNSTSARNPTGDPPIALEHIKRDEEFWLEDGNIVLLARDTVFRVYRGLIAAQSTVFADMFASSSPSGDGSETYDGCPLIPLSDSPEDLRHFLRVLLPKSQRLFFHGPKPKLTFDQVFAVIVLSHKYHVEDIERQALSSLKTYYNDDLDTWRWRHCSFESLIKHQKDEIITVEDVHAIGAIKLARLTDTPSILLMAMYMCCGLGSAVLNGWTREDGSVERLSAEDLKLCMDGRDALTREALAIVIQVLRANPYKHCMTKQRCKTTLQTLLVDAVASSPIIPDPIRFLHDNSLVTRYQFDEEDADLCGECLEDGLGREQRGQTDFWKRLPQLLNIAVPGWKV